MTRFEPTLTVAYPDGVVTAMLFGESYWAKDIIVLDECRYSTPRWKLFRLSGVVQEDSRQPRSYQRNIGDGWRDYDSTLSVNGFRGIFQPGQEEKAIGILLALNALHKEEETLIQSARVAVNNCIGEMISVDDIARKTEFVRAVAVHLKGERDGLTDAFLDETKASLERLLVRIKLAEG